MLKIGVVGTQGGWSSEKLADTVGELTGFRMLVEMKKVAFDFTEGKAYYGSTDLTGLDGMRFSWIGASGGYGYSWIWDEWWLTTSLFLGINYVTQSYSITSGTYEQSVPFNPKVNLKISAGRNSDDRYYGISFFGDNTVASTSESIEISANSFVVLFYYGWRL